MIHKNIEAITLEDLQSLQLDEVPEGKTLEYKRELPGESSEERKKLLRTVCSFANTEGGDLLYGVEARDGIPVALSGIEVGSEDVLRLRIENTIRDSIQPRIAKLELRFFPVDASRSILVMRVSKSWNAPHRLSQDGHFYGRNSAGSYPLDIGEIRQVFTLSETVPDRIRSFRADRLIKIGSGDAPIPIESGGTMVLHLVPLSAFTSVQSERPAFNSNERLVFSPFGISQWSLNVNLEGYIAFESRQYASSSYTQLFRTGIVEAVTVFSPINGESGLSPGWIEKEIIDALPRMITALIKKQVSPPFYVFLSFLKVRGYKLFMPQSIFRAQETLNDRDNLTLPEVVIEQPEINAASVMRPAFDAMWNAFGFEGSSNYDDAGNWSIR